MRASKSHDLVYWFNNMKPCPFCVYEEHKERIVWGDDQCILIYPKYYRTTNHLLAIPRYHTNHIEDLQWFDLAHYVYIAERILLQFDPTISWFNLLLNQWHDAGQTVQHLHFHIIWRKKDETTNPLSITDNLIDSQLFNPKTVETIRNSFNPKNIPQIHLAKDV